MSSLSSWKRLPWRKRSFETLMDLNRDKALRSDGFSLAFWKDCWELVKEEILCFFREFFFFKGAPL